LHIASHHYTLVGRNFLFPRFGETKTSRSMQNCDLFFPSIFLSTRKCRTCLRPLFGYFKDSSGHISNVVSRLMVHKLLRTTGMGGAKFRTLYCTVLNTSGILIFITFGNRHGHKQTFPSTTVGEKSSTLRAYSMHLYIADDLYFSVVAVYCTRRAH